MRPPSHYEVLGLAEDASATMVRRAYRARARATHPDLRGGADSAERFARVGEAYRVLSDPEARAAYDRWLAEERRLEPWARAGRAAGRLVAVGKVAADRAKRGPGRRGRTLRVAVNVPGGRTRGMEIVVPRPVACPACDGTGRKNGAPCGACGGAGRVVRDEAVAFDLPERVARRARLRLVGRGEQGVRGGADGDLVIDVTVDTPGGEER